MSTPSLARALPILLLAGLLPAQEPVPVEPAAASAEPLRFGMSTALSGPAADLGTEMRAGVMAAFQEINAAGGIRGSLLRLRSYDDGYEPKATVPNMRRLIEQDQVLGVIGNVGTPTAVAAMPIACASSTPFLFAFTGAGVLRRDPPDPWVVNYRASYAEETAAMVAALVDQAGLLPEEVGFFTQRDAYGDAGFAGGMSALERRGLSDGAQIAHGRYERNSLAVENGLAELLLAPVPVRAVILVGTYAPCAKAIRLARDAGLDALFLNVSFVGATSLAQALGDQGDGVLVTQVVPHFDSDLPLVEEYREAMRLVRREGQFSFASLEGYIAGRILCLALAESPDAPDRNTLVRALLALGEFDLGLGVPLKLEKGHQQACHSVWPTIIQGGEVLPFD